MMMEFITHESRALYGKSVAKTLIVTTWPQIDADYRAGNFPSTSINEAFVKVAIQAVGCYWPKIPDTSDSTFMDQNEAVDAIVERLLNTLTPLKLAKLLAAFPNGVPNNVFFVFFKRAAIFALLDFIKKERRYKERNPQAKDDEDDEPIELSSRFDDLPTFEKITFNDIIDEWYASNKTHIKKKIKKQFDEVHERRKVRNCFIVSRAEDGKPFQGINDPTFNLFPYYYVAEADGTDVYIESSINYQFEIIQEKGKFRINL